MNIDQERAAFEEHFKSLGVGAYQPHNNMYVADEIQERWEAWQARAAMQSQDREDAERYRALRAGMLRWDDVMPTRMAEYAETHFIDIDNPTTAEIDAAVDHARLAEGKGNDAT